MASSTALAPCAQRSWTHPSRTAPSWPPTRAQPSFGEVGAGRRAHVEAHQITAWGHGVVLAWGGEPHGHRVVLPHLSVRLLRSAIAFPPSREGAPFLSIMCETPAECELDQSVHIQVI